MATKRTTHRSSKSTKLYAVRDKKGQVKDIQSYKRPHPQDRFVWRDAKSGRYLDVKVADPHVRPNGVTIERIRRAVGKLGGGSARKEK